MRKFQNSVKVFKASTDDSKTWQKVYKDLPWGCCHNISSYYCVVKCAKRNPQVVQKTLTFSPPVLTIFNDFSDFLAFPCYGETNDFSI